MFYRSCFATLQYAIRKVKEYQVGLKLSGTRQLVVYADVHIMEANVITREKNTKALTDASKKTLRILSICWCLLNRIQGKVITHTEIKDDLKTWKSAYILAKAVTNKNLIHEEIKRDLIRSMLITPHRWCLHLIVVVGFVCSWDRESYASDSVATGRGTHVGQVRGWSQTKWDTLVLQVGVGRGTNNLTQ
jgi:hypothetical protein